MMRKFTAIASLILLATMAQANDEAEIYNVRMVVSVVQTPPYADEIYLAGSMNDWQPGTLAIPHVGNGVYVLTAKWPVGEPIEYKFTRGKTWASVEKGTYGEEVDNRVLTLEKTPHEVVVYNHIARWSDITEAVPTQTLLSIAPSEGTQRDRTRSGDIRSMGPLRAPQLGGTREVLVYLPPGYRGGEDRYPVLYMLDGQNVFDESTSYIGAEWGLDEAMEKGVPAGTLRPCIIVAVYNSGARVNEYTPFPHPRRGGGDADKFLDFLVNTVKPYIDQTFRTMPEREHTTFVGNSLGGLLTLYAATKHSDTFQSYGVVAPSLQWMNYKILDTLDSTKLPSDLRFWIEVGEGREPLVAPEEESGNGQPSVGKYTQACRRLADTLKAKGITADTQLHYTEHKSEFHDEREWGARAADMLNFLVR
jgi:predicted alpha/beta superfamily hydrolase